MFFSGTIVRSMSFNRMILVGSVFLLSISTASGSEKVAEPASQESHKSFFSLPENPLRPRNIFFPPLISFILPGFDQWIEKQIRPALIYSGSALLSMQLTYSLHQRGVHDDYVNSAVQIYIISGASSLYHSFRSAVSSRQHLGEYTFLKQDETPQQLLFAPLDFTHITKATTWVPLSVVGITFLAIFPMAFEDIGLGSPAFSEVFSGATISYRAGVAEEAVYRGYLMPVFMEATQSPFWSNTLTATLFALSHLGTVKVPVPQLIGGWYFGWVSQRREWTLSESIFIHTWYDIILFTAQALYNGSSRNKNKVDFMYLPLIQGRF